MRNCQDCLLSPWKSKGYVTKTFTTCERQTFDAKDHQKLFSKENVHPHSKRLENFASRWWLSNGCTWHCSHERHHVYVPELEQGSNLCRRESSRRSLTWLADQIGEATDSWKNLSRKSHWSAMTVGWNIGLHLTTTVHTRTTVTTESKVDVRMHARVNSSFNKHHNSGSTFQHGQYESFCIFMVFYVK